MQLFAGFGAEANFISMVNFCGDRAAPPLCWLYIPARKFGTYEQEVGKWICLDKLIIDHIVDNFSAYQPKFGVLSSANPKLLRLADACIQNQMNLKFINLMTDIRTKTAS